jgi:hypothetical protein
VRDLDDVARRPHTGLRGAHVVVDDDTARRAQLQPHRLGEGGVGQLVQADDRHVALELAVRGLHGADAAVLAVEALELRAHPDVDAERLERLLRGLRDVGVDELVQQPRALVDELHVDVAPREPARHLDAEPHAADHDRALDRVELLVELHRAPDVLDVVEPFEVRARHLRLLPREAGADDQLVEALVGVTRRHRALVEVDLSDDGLHPHVEPVVDVALHRRQEEALELRDLAAVHVRDPARRVGDVLELREHRHLEVGVGALGDGRRGGPRAAAPDDDETLGHVPSPLRRYS